MSGVAGIFLDTDVIVYARDHSELSKGPFAAKLLEEVFLAGRPLVSAQVLSE